MSPVRPDPLPVTAFLSLLVLVGALLSACSDTPSLYVLEGSAFGTGYQVQIVMLDPGSVPPGTRALSSTIEQELTAIDRSLSTWREDSEISAFNRRRDDAWVTLSPPFAEVMAGASAAWQVTGGAFDITLWPLSLAWGFQGERAPHEPPTAEVDALRTRTGMHLLQLSSDGRSLRKNAPDVEIDLSAIAKGYAVDRIGAVLASAGHEHWLVEIGGEVLARGTRPDGQPWRIAVTSPGGPATAASTGRPLPDLPVLELRDEAVATSGDYRNALLLDGRRLGHVLDPATGRPAAQGVASATVTAPTAMRADALATAFLVMAPERALALADDLGVGVLLLLRDAEGLRMVSNARFRARTTDAAADP